jgi:hypothetical protein
MQLRTVIKDPLIWKQKIGDVANVIYITTAGTNKKYHLTVIVFPSGFKS